MGPKPMLSDCCAELICVLLHHRPMLLHAGGVTSFKATDKKVVNKNQQGQQQPDQAATQQQEEERGPWHGMKNLGDMEGTLDGWVLLLSFSLSLITAIVGVFQMIDKPFTAQVRDERGRHSCSACVNAQLPFSDNDLPDGMLLCTFNGLNTMIVCGCVTCNLWKHDHVCRASSAGSSRCPSSGPSTT